MNKFFTSASNLRVACAAIALSTTGAASAAEVWSAPAVVSTDVSTGGKPRIATDRAGKWAEVWQRIIDGETRYSRSTNNAISWPASAEMPVPNASNDRGNPDVAADLTSGTFLSVFLVDDFADNKYELATAIAAAGLTTSTFTSVGVPVSFFNNGYQGLLGPRIASGGIQTWVTAASTSNGTDEQLLLFQSLNDGQNWSNPSIIDQTTVSLGVNRNLGVAGDGSNNWVAVWERRKATDNSPLDVYYTRSTNNGAAWSPAIAFNATLPPGIQPAVAADNDNSFVTVFVQGTGASSLKAYRTADGGAVWQGPVAVNAAGPSITDTPTNPDVACDGQGSCIAVWSATPTASTAKQIFYATSANRGQTWSSADILTTGTAGAIDEFPQIEYDGAGRWVTTWQRTTGSGPGSVQLMSSKLIFPVRADLSVTQTDTPDPALANGTVTYNLTVKNDGPSSATNVVLTDTLPTTGSLSVTKSQGTHTETSGVVTIKIGNMAAGAVVTAAITTRIGATGIYTNVAKLTSTEPDIDTQDRTSTETTRVLVEGIDLQGEWTEFAYKVPRRLERGKLRINGTFTVSNFGTKRAGQTVALLVFSDDEIVSDDDAFCDSIPIELLESGKSRKIRFNRNIHRGTPWQDRYLLVVLDSEKRINEADETNNTFVSDQLTLPEAL